MSAATTAREPPRANHRVRRACSLPLVHEQDEMTPSGVTRQLALAASSPRSWHSTEHRAAAVAHGSCASCAAAKAAHASNTRLSTADRIVLSCPRAARGEELPSRSPSSLPSRSRPERQAGRAARRERTRSARAHAACDAPEPGGFDNQL